MNATNHTLIVYVFFFMVSSCCIKEGDAVFLGQIRFKSMAGQSQPSVCRAGALIWIHPQKHYVCILCSLRAAAQRRIDLSCQEHGPVQATPCVTEEEMRRQREEVNVFGSDNKADQDKRGATRKQMSSSRKKVRNEGLIWIRGNLFSGVVMVLKA